MASISIFYRRRHHDHPFFPAVKIFDSYWSLNDYGESVALSHRLDVNDVYSNSWGPSDNGEIFEAPGPLAQEALERSIREVHTVQLNQSSISYDKWTCSTVYNLLYDLIMFVNCKEKDWTTGNVLKVLSIRQCTCAHVLTLLVVFKHV